MLENFNYPQVTVLSHIYGERHYCITAGQILRINLRITNIFFHYDCFQEFNFEDRRDETLHNYFDWIIEFYQYRIRLKTYSISLNSNLFQNYLR